MILPFNNSPVAFCLPYTCLELYSTDILVDINIRGAKKHCDNILYNYIRYILVSMRLFKNTAKLYLCHTFGRRSNYRVAVSNSFYYWRPRQNESSNQHVLFT